MHFLGIAIIKERTREALDQAMAPFDERDGGNPNGEWDWYRAGGRWDGWLEGEEEVKRRETHGGFNFDPANDDVERNSCLARDFPFSRGAPYFFLVDGAWIAKKTRNPDWDYEKHGFRDEANPFERPTEDYDLQFAEALRKNPDAWAVVVDVHS